MEPAAAPEEPVLEQSQEESEPPPQARVPAPHALVPVPHALAYTESRGLSFAQEYDQELLIRNQAIEFAVIACGRALRHVAAIHPRLVAAFVDDAMVAAGQPEQRTIATTVIGDGAELGTIALDIGDARIETDIETRAALLARAAAAT